MLIERKCCFIIINQFVLWRKPFTNTLKFSETKAYGGKKNHHLPLICHTGWVKTPQTEIRLHILCIET